MIGMIKTDNRNANWIPSTPPEVRDLLNKISGYPVNLFDHRFGQNLDLDSNLDGRDRTSRYDEPRVRDRQLSGDDFSECSVSAPSRNAPCAIVNIQHALVSLDGLDEFR